MRSGMRRFIAALVIAIVALAPAAALADTYHSWQYTGYTTWARTNKDNQDTQSNQSVSEFSVDVSQLGSAIPSYDIAYSYVVLNETTVLASAVCNNPGGYPCTSALYVDPSGYWWWGDLAARAATSGYVACNTISGWQMLYDTQTSQWLVGTQESAC